jgi:hypothetical protein
MPLVNAFVLYWTTQGSVVALPFVKDGTDSSLSLAYRLIVPAFWQSEIPFLAL